MSDSRFLHHLETEPINDGNPLDEGEIAIQLNGALVRPLRAPNGMFRLKPESGPRRVIEDCVAALTHGGADLVWIETSTPDIDAFSAVMAAIQRQVPNALAVYNNSPSFNWTKHFRRRVLDRWIADGCDDAKHYDDRDLLDASLDDDPLGLEADQLMRSFQLDMAKAGVFHHLITLPPFHMTAISMDDVRSYFGAECMLAYVENVQLEEIRRGLPVVRHQHFVGTEVFDFYRRMQMGDQAIQASGEGNTMDQFDAVA